MQICNSIVTLMITLRSKKLKQGYSLYLDIYHKGVRNFEFLGLVTTKNYTGRKPCRIANNQDRIILELAKEKLIERLAQFVRAGYVYTAPDKIAKKNIIEYYWEKIPELHSHHEVTARSLANYLTQANLSINIDQVDSILVERYQKWLISNDVSADTCNTYTRRIKRLLEIAYKEKAISAVPEIKALPISSKERTYLDDIEVEKLWASHNEDSLKMAFLFSCYTGLRFSDIRILKWDAVQDGCIHLVIEKTKKKKKHPISIPLADRALQLIEKAREKAQDSEYLFVLPTNQACNRRLKTWVKQIGINKRVSYHVARHSFATNTLDKNVELYTVSKLLGHSDISTTQIYAQVTMRQKKEAINRLESGKIKNDIT